MKKILLLATVMMLFAAVGLVADVSFGGFVRTRATADVDDDNKSGEFAAAFSEIVISVSGDYNVGTVRVNTGTQSNFTGLDDDNELEFGTDALVKWDRAHFTTDVSGWLAGEMGVELPVGLSNQIGHNEWTYRDVAKASLYEFESFHRLPGMARSVAVANKLNVSIPDIGNVYAVIGLGPEVDADGDSRLSYMVFGADAGIDVGVGTVMVEAAYAEEGSIDTGKGDFGVNLAFASDALVEGVAGKVGTSLVMPQGDDTADLYYGVGAGIQYGALVDASVSYWSGMGDKGAEPAEVDQAEISWLGFGLKSAPVEFLGVGAALLLNLSDDDQYDDDTELVNSANMWLDFKMGAATYTVGYFMLNSEGQKAARVAGPDYATTFSNVYLQARMNF